MPEAKRTEYWRHYSRKKRSPKKVNAFLTGAPAYSEPCPFDASKGKVDVSGFDRFLSRPIPIGDYAP